MGRITIEKDNYSLDLYLDDDCLNEIIDFTFKIANKKPKPKDQE